MYFRHFRCPAYDMKINVHRGLYISAQNEKSINDHLAVLRELLKRIFLTLLKYNGEYQSFLNGPAWINFTPSHNRKETG